MSDKYLVIFTNKETGKYDHYDLYPKNVCTEEELKNKIEDFNNSKNSLKAEWHNNDVFTDFVSNYTEFAFKKNLINSLRNIVNSIDTNISELESWKDSIEELLNND